MKISTFLEMYIAELQELVSVEDQLTGSLLRMAQVASHPALKNALIRHRGETAQHRQGLRSLLKKHDAGSKTHTDQAMQALVVEAEKMLSILQGKDLRDAGHYEIAGYGTAAALAGQLELREDQKLLHDILEDEKRTDVVLTQLAKSEINRNALAA